MSFRFRLAAWFGCSLLALLLLLMLATHWHLDEELRRDRWDRSHPRYPDWVIHGSFTDEEVHDILGELTQVWLWVGGPAVGLALGVGILLAQRSVRPIDTINCDLSLLQARSLSRGIRVPESDPVLSTLVQHINGLLERVGQAYNNLDEFAGRVSHEIRTPLTVMRLKIERSAAELPPGLSEELQEELARLSRLVEQSLLAARAESGRVTIDAGPVDFDALFDELREVYTLLAAERSVQLSWRSCSVGCVVTDSGLLRQILHNVLGNAMRYARTQIRVGVRRYSRGVVVSIANDFDESTRSESGTGLGLRLVRGLTAVLGVRFLQRSIAGGFGVRLVVPDRTPPSEGVDGAHWGQPSVS